MERRRIRSILSLDADFDRWPGLMRICQFSAKEPGRLFVPLSVIA